MCDAVNAKFYTTLLMQFAALADAFDLLLLAPPPPPPPPPALGVSIVEYGETVQKWQSEHLFAALKSVCG